MRLVPSAAVAATLAAFAIPTGANAGCANCYAPPPCVTCYQQQVVPPQYRTVNETVMVSPGRVIAHRIPPRYATVMVPQTVLVEPGRIVHEEIPPQYATVQRTEIVAPARTYYVPVQPRCGNCGW
jgi:hypothetical protein